MDDTPPLLDPYQHPDDEGDFDDPSPQDIEEEDALVALLADLAVDAPPPTPGPMRLDGWPPGGTA